MRISGDEAPVSHARVRAEMPRAPWGPKYDPVKFWMDHLSQTNRSRRSQRCAPFGNRTELRPPSMAINGPKTAKIDIYVARSAPRGRFRPGLDG